MYCQFTFVVMYCTYVHTGKKSGGGIQIVCRKLVYEWQRKKKKTAARAK